MNILKSNQKPVSFNKVLPTYPEYKSLTVLVNDMVRAINKVLTHCLLDLHRTEHAYTSTVIQKLRNLLHSQQKSSHKHLQDIYKELQENLAFVKNSGRIYSV